MFGNQPRDQDEVGIDAVLAFRDQHGAWMCTGTHTVISTIIDWMAYGKGYRLVLHTKITFSRVDYFAPLCRG